MSYINPILFLITTYLIASIPFGLVISKIFKKKDVRSYGSKNIGATNVARVLGKKLGFLTLMLDASKGAVMVILAGVIFANSPHVVNILALTAFISVIGHVFSIYLKFKGGKGVATAIAVILVINPLLGTVMVVMWLLIFSATKISAIASLLSILMVSLFSVYDKVAIEQIALYLSLLIIIAIRHKENIIRIKNGKENRI